MKLPHPERPDTRSATLAPVLWVMTGLSAFFAMTVLASDPTWWSNGAVNYSLGTNDFAGVNQGQLKQFTARAVDDMNANLTNATLGIGGAGLALTTLAQGWSNDYVTGDYSATNRMPSDYQAVSVGQLKYIASLYYGQLTAAGYTAAWPSWLYPNSAVDNEMANVGQLKTVFNFTMTNAPAAPTNLTVTTQADGDVEVTWQETTPNVTGYTVQRSDDGGLTWTNVDVVGTDNNDDVLDSSLAGSSGSLFQVVANNGGTSSAPTSTSGGQTKSSASSAPAAPSNLMVTNGTAANSFQLTWQDNSGGTAGFIVQGSMDGGTTWVGSGNGFGSISAGTTNDTVSPDPKYLWIFRVKAQSSASSGSTDIVSADGVDTDLAAHYALIDIGPNLTGMFVNDVGQAVYADTNLNYYFWNGGTPTQITPPSTNMFIITAPVGLNNGGTVAVGLGQGGYSGPYYNSTNGDATDQGTATWTVGGGSVVQAAVPALINATNGPPLIDRRNWPVGLNDSGTVIGTAHEYWTGPYWDALAAIKNNAVVGDAPYYFDYAGPYNYVQGGRLFTLTAINNSNTMIGSYQDITTNDYSYSIASPPVNFYGTGSGDVHTLTGVPMAINDNGVITGTNTPGTTNLIWLPNAHGGYDKKIVYPNPIYGYYVSYANNHMQTARGWQDYRWQNWSNLTSSIPTNWTNIGGISISHNSGIIIGSAMTNGVNHAVELVPIGLRLLNGYTRDFNGTTITSVIPSPENPSYTNDTNTEGGSGLGPQTMGQGRAEAPGNVYTAPIMVAAQVPATIPWLQYQWKRYLTRRSWYIQKQTTGGTNSWYVTQRSSRGTATPADDTDNGTWSNTNPSSVKHEFYEFDDSALLYGNFANDTNGYMPVGSYILEEKAFTYQVNTSLDGTHWTTGVSMPVAQVITVKYQATGGTAATDWVGVTSLQSGNTNYVGSINPIITTNMVQAIVGSTNITIDSAANN